MVQRFAETGHPIFKSISALSGSILKRKQNKDTTHFNAGSSNTELLFRNINSANQLNIYGAVSNWCEVFGQKPNETETSAKLATTEQTLKEVRPQEVNSPVQTPRDDQRPLGNRLRDTLQNWIQKRYSQICGAAVFWELVSVSMRYKTIPDVDDGFGGRTPVRKEYSHPRENTNSRIFFESQEIR